MKKFLKIIGIILISIIVLSWLVSSNETETKKPVITGSSKNKDSAPTEIVKAKSQLIPGLMPVDVYLNMEKQGFTTEHIFDTENNFYEWTCKHSVEGLDFRVEVSGNKVDNVNFVRATAMIDPAFKKSEAAMPFIKFVSSLPYEGSIPTKAVQWVEENFNTHQAKTTIGGVKFEIFAPTVGARIIVITP